MLGVESAGLSETTTLWGVWTAPADPARPVRRATEEAMATNATARRERNRNRGDRLIWNLCSLHGGLLGHIGDVCADLPRGLGLRRAA